MPGARLFAFLGIAQISMSTTPKRVVGRPFQKGDPRINRGGRPPALLSKAMQAVVSDEDAEAIMKRVLAAAKKGDLQAIQMLWDRMEGKAVARNEQGQPGAFDLDLSDVETSALKAALRRVK